MFFKDFIMIPLQCSSMHLSMIVEITNRFKLIDVGHGDYTHFSEKQ